MGTLLKMHSIVLAALCAGSIVAQGERSRLTETTLDIPYEQNTHQLAESLEKPLYLSGYFKLNRTYDARMFYFFFEAAEDAREAPLVVWMTGGPGCSSELAVFYENGPFHITSNLTLEKNPYGWDQSHNMIFVDQPINTGFSYSNDERDRVYDEKVVAADMLDFLAEFREAHPSYFDADLFVTGESYGGHYVPAVTYGLVQYNKDAEEPFRLKGMAIGNGLTNPAVQFGALADFSFANGLISRSLQTTLNTIYPICSFTVNACNSLGWDFVCGLALTICTDFTMAPIQAAGGNFNVYDIRKPCIGPLCYDFSRLDDYLAQPSVRAMLGVGDRPWQSCDPGVYADFVGDFMRDYEDLVSAQLEAGIQVRIYVGVEDWICNWVGNKRWVDALQWSQAESFAAAAEERWALGDAVAGSIKEWGPLSFVKMFNSGHMVPMDQPPAALEMITSFTRGRPLVRAGAHTEPAAEAGRLVKRSSADADSLRVSSLMVE